MPQARLPDVNTAFITYRREALISLKVHQHRSCYGALNCINALLPQKYRVILDNDKFKDDSKISFIYCCTVCNERIDQVDVDIFNYALDPFEVLSTDKKIIKVWECPKCNKLNNLSKTDIIKDMLALPSFIHTVPMPPERKNGLLGRTAYRKEFASWAWNYLTELEERMAMFRDDNWTKENSDYFNDDDVDTDVEEETTIKG